jgi:hypothetical protein
MIAAPSPRPVVRKHSVQARIRVNCQARLPVSQVVALIPAFRAAKIDPALRQRAMSRRVSLPVTVG